MELVHIEIKTLLNTLKVNLPDFKIKISMQDFKKTSMNPK